jgi:hypothetical protein
MPTFALSSRSWAFMPTCVRYPLEPSFSGQQRTV